MAQTFGKLDSWETEAKEGGAFDKNDFLNMKDDKVYAIRIGQDAPCIYAIHWAKDANGKAKRINCAMTDCPLCAEGNNAQQKYLIAAINRERGRVQLVEFGRQVYNQIVKLRKDKDWGDPRSYDIKIDKDRARGMTDTYRVTPVPRGMGPLNAEEELMVKDFLARVSVDKFAQPSKVEEINRKLGRSDSAEPTSPFVANGAPKSAVVADDDFDFT